MSESANTGSPKSPPLAADPSHDTSGLDATVPVSQALSPDSDLAVDVTVPVSQALSPDSDPAVDATVRISKGSPASGIDPVLPDVAASSPASETTDELYGRTLQHFKVLERIGAGGMGCVYRAHDLSLDRTVALKVIRAEAVQATAQRERFIREARSQARLSHPNVVPIFYIGEEEGLLFFAMELVDGEPLDRLLARGERLDWPRALKLLHDVADALCMAHQRSIVHRDIKPSNLLVDPSGLVKVADFGLAKSVASGEAVDVQLTQQGAVLGSPLYMSPEQGQGEEVDHRSDIYSLGATFYHLLAGQPPFTSKTAVGVIAKHLSEPVPPLQKILPKLPDGVARLVERMLAKDPAERFPDYESLQRAIRAARPDAATPAGFFARGMALVVDLVLMGLLVAGETVVLGWDDPEPVLLVPGVLYLLGGWWLFGQTLGKWLFKLRVRTLDNEPLTLWRSTVRLVAWGWGPLVLAGLSVINRIAFGAWGIGHAGPAYTRDPPLAKLLILLAMLTFLVYFVSMLWAAIRRHKRAWHDLIAGTMVVYHLRVLGTTASSGVGTSLGPLSRTSSRDR